MSFSSSGTFTTALRFGFTLCSVARLAQCLTIAQVCSCSAFGYWHDVIGIGCWLSALAAAPLASENVSAEACSLRTAELLCVRRW